MHVDDDAVTGDGAQDAAPAADAGSSSDVAAAATPSSAARSLASPAARKPARRTAKTTAATKASTKAASTKPAARTTAATKRAAKTPASRPSAKPAPGSKPAGKHPAEGTRRVKPKRMTGWDFATWRTASGDPSMRSPIIGLVLLDSSPDWEALVERFDRASRVAAVLRQKVVQGPGDVVNPRLVIDPDFDLSFHLRRFRIALPGTWAQVLDEVRRQSMTDFDLQRPLWRVTLLEGLEGGRSALIVKLHHAIADGQGAMMLGATVVDFAEEPADLGPMPPVPVAGADDEVSVLGSAARDARSLVLRSAKEAVDAARPLAGKVVTDPLGLVEDVARLLRSVARFVAVPTRPLSPVMTGRSINYHFATFDLPLAELKKAAKSRGLTLNDAFMGGVTGGLHRYHEARGESIESLRVNMPISLRDPAKPTSNAVTIARFEVPIAEDDLGERMQQIHDTVDAWRREPALHLADALAEMSRLVPTEMLAAAARTSDFTTSNVPGVPVPVWVGGARVLRMYPMVATIGAAVNVTLLSYASLASIGVSMDDAAVEDRALFVRCLAEGFAEVVGDDVAPAAPLAPGAPSP